MTVQTVLDFLFQLAPKEYAMSWDNVGHLLGRREAPVNRVLVALDATADVAEEAAALGCQLIVTHHPVIFNSIRHLTDADPMTHTALKLLEQGIAVISMHTNLDCVPGGVTDELARLLGLERTAVLPNGAQPGVIRVGEVAPTTLADFAALVKARLGCEGLRFTDGGKPVRRVALCGGAGMDFVEQVMDAGCDTFVTADVRYHEFQEMQIRGLNLIDAGHFQTENPICALLRGKLAAAFPEIEVLLSRHGDCIRFF